MRETWVDFCRRANIAQDSVPWDHGEWFNWLDYAAKHYKEPLTLSPAGDWGDR